MIMNMNEKGRQTKLLAAIAVLAMVVCALAVVMPSDNVDAVSTEKIPATAPLGEENGIFEYDNGVYTVSGDYTIDVSATGMDLGTSSTPLDISFEIAEGATLTFTNSGTTSKTVYITNVYAGTQTGSAPEKSVFYGGSGTYGEIGEAGYGTLAVDGNVELALDIDVTTGGQSGNMHVLYDVNVALTDGANITISQTAGTQSYFCSSTENFCDLTMTGGSEMVFDAANGMSGVNGTISDDSEFRVENPKSSGTVWMNFSNLEIDETSVVTVESSAATDTGIYIAQTLQNYGTISTPNSAFAAANGSEIINRGTIEASSLVGSTSSTTTTANIYNYGTFDVETSYNNTVKSSVVAESSAEVTSYFNEDDYDVVMVEAAVNISGVSVPAGKELIISGDATIGTITISGAGAVLTLNGAATQNGTVNSEDSGVTDGTIEFNNATGFFQITYGSCNVIMDLITGSVELGGIYDADGTSYGTNGTISGTLAEGTTVTVTGDYNVSGKLTVNGRLVVDGGRLNLNTQTVTLNGDLVVTGDNGRVRAVNSTLTVNTDANITGISIGVIGSTYSNNIYGALQKAITTQDGDQTFVINGDYTDNMVFVNENNSNTLQVAPGSSFIGDVVYQYSSGTQGQTGYETHTNTVSISCENTTQSNITIATVSANAKVITISNSTITGIDGCEDANEENASEEIVLNNVILSGLILNDKVKMTGDNNQISNGEIVTFDVDGCIVLDSSAKLYVYGDVAKTSSTSVVKGKINNTNGIVYYTTQNYRNLAAVVTITDSAHFSQMAAKGISTVEELLANYSPGMTYVLVDNDLVIDTVVELDNVTIYTNGWDIIVGKNSNGTLILNNSTIDRDATVSVSTGNAGPETRESITVNRGSSMEINDSLLFIEVYALTGSSVDTNNANVTYDNTTSEVRVGYGTTLNFSGTAVSSIDVYGNLVISSNVSLPATNEFNVWSGATVSIESTFTSLGDVKFYQGSDVTVADGATFTLGDRNGGADMTVHGDFTVASGGTFTVTGVSNNAVASNTLAVRSTGDYEFTVEGTMNMNGVLAGEIQDKGTINFNGTVADNTSATIVIYNGVTLSNVSVSGTLSVSDAGITETVGTSVASNGNIVCLTDVRGVTITETVNTVLYTVNGQNHRDYVSTMDVSGTLTTGAIVGTIEFTSSDVVLVGPADDRQNAGIIISGELILGKDVIMSVTGGDVTVSGTVTATVENSSGFLNSYDKVSVSDGELTVTGTITINDQEIDGIANVNAVWYVVTGTDAETYTYTNFVDAVAAAANADQDTIYVVGTVTVSETVEVPAGIIVEIGDGATLIIATDITVTVADGATVNGSKATIDVNGTLVSNDYAEDMNVKTIVADVVTTNGAVRTWTNLANALAGASAGDTIVANGPIMISADTTIPVDVTVYTEYPFVIDGATLTVDGTLQLDDKAQNDGTIDGKVYNGLYVTSNEDSEITVSGVISIETLGEPAEGVYIGDDLDGAHFAVNNGAFVVSYVSNVEFAAETASNNMNLIDGVTIKGIVSAGDVTFTAPENLSLTIRVVEMASGTDNMTIFTMGTMTLAGNATFTIADNNSRVTGTVAALCGDGTTSANVVLTAAMGSNSFSIAASSEETADGTEYTAAISGGYTGAVDIAAGEVTVSGALVMGTDATLEVATSATMSITSNGTVSVAYNEDGEAFVVDGILNVANDDAFTGSAVAINGTMNTDSLILTTTLRIAGTLNVNEDETLTISSGKLIVGDKPTQLGESASGAVNGTIAYRANAGYILAYAGADLSGAQIDVNAATGESDADSTTYYINGEAYATIIAADANTAILIGGIQDADGDIELTGLANSSVYWFETAEEADAAYAGTSVVSRNNINGDAVGSFDSAYTVYAPAIVHGTISNGQGITLYLDGNVVIGDAYSWSDYELGVGTHTVSISANAGYTIENATITFNGQTVQNGGTITVTADMNTFTLATSGAIPSESTVVVDNGGNSDMSLTDYLLIVLVILIVIMAIIVALRLMRS